MSKPNASAESELDALRAELGERDRAIAERDELIRTINANSSGEWFIHYGVIFRAERDEDVVVSSTPAQAALLASILKDGE